jgi:hypothetical protein
MPKKAKNRHFLRKSTKNDLDRRESSMRKKVVRKKLETTNFKKSGEEALKYYYIGRSKGD